MKSIKIYLFFVISVIFLVISCNIEPFDGDISNQDDNLNNFEVGSFKVDFDGKTFDADNIVATFLDDVINITGIKTNTNEIVILTVFGNSTGTYQFGVTQNQVEVNGATYNNASGTGETWVAVTDFTTSQGEITITEIDEANNTISGTFFFTGHNVSSTESKSFTNGVFNKISYSSDISPDNNNSFFAKVDGEEFVEDDIQAFSLSLGGMSTIGISAVKTSLETISISFDADITVGEHSFSSVSNPLGQYIVSTAEGYVSDDGGKLTITEHDVTNKRIEGTFEFTASEALGGSETHEITEGSFEVTYN